jgi:hypothetical protein
MGCGCWNVHSASSISSRRRFLLISARQGRTQKLKDLLEIGKALPDTLNAGYGLQRVMLRQLYEIERVSTGWYFNIRVWSIGVIFMLLFSMGVLVFPQALHANSTARTIVGLTSNIFGGVFIIVVGIYVKRKEDQLAKPYKTRLKVLDALDKELVDEIEASLTDGKPKAVVQTDPAKPEPPDTTGGTETSPRSGCPCA